MFCIVANREDHIRWQLQAALLKEMDHSRWSIEQSMGTLEAKIEEMTPSRSGEASYSRARDAATKDLRQELGFLREHVLRELDGMRSKVILGPLPNQIRLRLWPFLLEPPSLRQILRVMPWTLGPRVGWGGVHWGCLGACGQRTRHPSVCLERKTPQASPREEKPFKNRTKKKRKGRSRRRQR